MYTTNLGKYGSLYMSLIADPRNRRSTQFAHICHHIGSLPMCAFAGFDFGCFSLFDSGAGLIVSLPCVLYLLAKVVVLRKSLRPSTKHFPRSSL